MRLRIEEDLFLNKQPEMAFVEELKKPLHEKTPPDWNKRKKTENEIFLSAVSIDFSFPDPEGLLETAYADFDRFLRMAHIEKRENAYPLTAEMGSTECREAYRIVVTEEGCRLIAADTEGSTTNDSIQSVIKNTTVRFVKFLLSCKIPPPFPCSPGLCQGLLLLYKISACTSRNNIR